MQVREAEFYRSEVSAVRRRRTSRKARAQGQHFLRMLALSEVQVHFGGEADSGEVSGLRPRLPGRAPAQGRAGDRVSEQRMRLRARPRGRSRGTTGCVVRWNSSKSSVGNLVLRARARCPRHSRQDAGATYEATYGEESDCTGCAGDHATLRSAPRSRDAQGETLVDS